MPGIFDTACQQGFLYAVAVLGIVLTLRVLNWPDLTVDGSFTLGGAVLAVMATNGWSPWTGMLAAAAAGFLAGTATFLLNRKLGISKILAGILIMLILYSINLRIMGRANISLLRVTTVFGCLDDYGLGNLRRILVYSGIAGGFLLGLCYLMTARLGLFLRATGDNEYMVRAQGVNTNWIFLIGIGLSNALVATSGALVAQNQGFADVNMGIGLIVTGIAALIIGESFVSLLVLGFRLLWPKRKDGADRAPASGTSLLPWPAIGELSAACLGAFIYFLILAICLRAGLAPTDLRLATGVLVILGIAFRFSGPTIETYMRGKL